MTDLTKPEDLVREIFDSDEGVKKQFENRFSGEILKFAEAIAGAFARYDKLVTSPRESVQTGLVLAFLHGVLDDLVTSMKLFVTGKLGASGNLVRQTLEGICMAILCSESEPLSFKKDEAVYWKLVESEDERSEGNRAIYILEANYDRLGVLQAGADQLKNTIKTYHQASHAGRLAMAYRMDLGPNDMGHIGGHFDDAKIEGYQKELEQRIRLCGTVIETLDVLKPVLEELRKSIPKT